MSAAEVTRAEPEAPYVGPRSFTERDGAVFHGRREEAKRLLSLAINDRTLLLYARSGAGKSSVVNAWLIPELRKLTSLNDNDEITHYEAISIRVGGELPCADLVDINLFAVNTLAHLRPADKPLPPADELKGLTLGEMLERHWRIPDVPTWLIFDQFEEIFTAPAAQEATRAQFFAQLGDVLRAPDSLLSAIFVIRDDYLARLSPYAHLLPNQFRTRFYMDLLRGDEALKAIAEPVIKFGFTYAKGAAEELRDKLVSVNVGPDGNYVEPVLLQVVCQQLWEKVKEKEGEKLITTDDVAGQDDVNRALRNYYEDAVREISKGVRAREEKIRSWFSDKLIVPPGVRAQVMEEDELSGGLSTDIAKEFLAKHLLRREQVRGAFWYELAHDRLVRPVQDSNLAWFEQSGNKYQRLARRWENEKFPDSLLLNKQELEEAEAWLQQDGGEPDWRVSEFLKDSRKADDLRQAREEADKSAALERLNAEQKELLEQGQAERSELNERLQELHDKKRQLYDKNQQIEAERFELDKRVQELYAKKLEAEAETLAVELKYKRAKLISKFLLPLGIILVVGWFTFNVFIYYRKVALEEAREAEATKQAQNANQQLADTNSKLESAKKVNQELASRRLELLRRIYAPVSPANEGPFFAQADAADTLLQKLSARYPQPKSIAVGLPDKASEMGELPLIMRNAELIDARLGAVPTKNNKPSDSIYYRQTAIKQDLWKLQYVALVLLRAGRKVVKISDFTDEQWFGLGFPADVPLVLGSNSDDSANRPSLTINDVINFGGSLATTQQSR